MDPGTARVVRPARPAWRAYLLLARVSNLPTVWTNVLAGMTISQAPPSWPLAAALSAAISLMYCGGMFLNDAFDSDVDARFRPDRPIPAGEVPRRRVFAVGFALVGAGVLLVAASGSQAALAWGLLLAGAIIYYDARHKTDPLGPLVMGLCRGLVYCVAAAAAAGMVSATVVWMAVIMTGYVVALTWVAKQVGPKAGLVVPVLLAGISLVDAVMIWQFGPAWLAMIAAVGFVLTLLFQRIVPGT